MTSHDGYELGRPPIYIGNTVYAAFDGCRIWLQTAPNHKIPLEPSVFYNLAKYAISKGYKFPGGGKQRGDRPMGDMEDRDEN